MLLLSAMAFDVIESTTTTHATISTTGIDGDAIIAADPTENHQPIAATFDNGTYKAVTDGALGLGLSFDGFDGFGDWTFEKCASWQRPPHHLYFQLANALFFIAFMSPCGSYGLLCARCALVIGSILMTMWGYLIECTVDVIVWSGSFLVVNVIYLFVLVYRLRPIRFAKEIESVSSWKNGNETNRNL